MDTTQLEQGSIDLPAAGGRTYFTRFVQALCLFVFLASLGYSPAAHADDKSLPGLTCRSLTNETFRRYNSSLVNRSSTTKVVFCPLVIDAPNKPIRWVDVYVVDKSSSANVVCRLEHGWRNATTWSFWTDSDSSVGHGPSRQRLDLDPNSDWGLDTIATAHVRCELPGSGSSIVSIRYDED